MAAMRPITSRMHGMLDYPAGIVLILAPWIFGFSDVGGAAVILQSLMTNYEYSVADVLPLRAHLAVDVVAGIVLAASPFVFGFADEGANAWIPHVVAGLGLLAAGLMTQGERETLPGGANPGAHHGRPDLG